MTSTFLNPGYAVGYAMLRLFSDTDLEYIGFLLSNGCQNLMNRGFEKNETKFRFFLADTTIRPVWLVVAECAGIYNFVD